MSNQSSCNCVDCKILEIAPLLPSHWDFTHELHENNDCVPIIFIKKLMTFSTSFVPLMSTQIVNSLSLDHFIQLSFWISASTQRESALSLFFMLTWCSRWVRCTTTTRKKRDWVSELLNATAKSSGHYVKCTISENTEHHLRVVTQLRWERVVAHNLIGTSLLSTVCRIRKSFFEANVPVVVVEEFFVLVTHLPSGSAGR